MIRFGMNKKTLDPINSDLPFYVKENGKYEPVTTLFVTGPSRSFYAADNSTYKYVWMETEASVEKNVQRSPMNNKVHINKENIILNMKTGSELPVCSVSIDGTTSWCDEVLIQGPCQVLYAEGKDPEVCIETDSDITLIGERIDYIP